MNPVTKEAYRLFHEGSLALAQAERNGIRIDVRYCKQATKDMLRQNKDLAKKIFSTKAGRYWKYTYGSGTKLRSGDQLRVVLKKIYGVDVKGSLDKIQLSKIEADVDIVKDILLYRKIDKACGTYLQGILKASIDGYLHPDFNLHTARTHRSSCSNPNFQNIPIRDPWVAKIIRRAFIPRKGHRILEKDYSGLEVHIAACYHKDPTMLEYLRTGYDMHSEMASECYKIPKKEVLKPVRYSAKNRFVFPAFYGSYFEQIAPDLWGAITEFGLKTKDGVSLKKHLRRKGIKDYQDFKEHIHKVELNFWNKRFPVYTQWKKDWWEDYLQKGYFYSKTGFVCRGYMKRNEAINYPVQGAAFHCLLWAFIEMTKAIKKYKMDAVLIGQIHDSVLGDVPENEFDDYVALFKEISMERIRQAWEWIILPLEIEVEATDVDKSWFTKKEIE